MELKKVHNKKSRNRWLCNR